jgi:hypothetical protein
MPDDEKVTITKAEYDSLKDDADWLTCLEAAGVDNWDGYEVARDIQRDGR